MLSQRLIKYSGAPNLHWVAGHTGLAPNELADVAAKEAATNAALLIDTPASLTITDIKRDFKKYTNRVWQNLVKSRTVVTT